MEVYASLVKRTKTRSVKDILKDIQNTVIVMQNEQEL